MVEVEVDLSVSESRSMVEVKEHWRMFNKVEKDD
jgi:hypothetical protein